MIPFAENVVAIATWQQRLQQGLPMLLNGPDNALNRPFPLGFRHLAGGLSHGHKQQVQKNW